MDQSAQYEPWERLEQIVVTGRPAEAIEFLESLPPGDASLVLSRLSEPTQSRLLTLLPADVAAELVDLLPDAQASELIQLLDPEAAAAIVREMPSNEQADLLGDLSDRDAEAILGNLAPEDAEGLRQLKEYPDDLAGGLMLTEVLAYPDTLTVAEVVADLRANADSYRDYQVQYAFVLGNGRLSGVLRLRDLLLAQPGQPIRALMIPDPISVRDTTPLSDMRDFFDTHDFLGVPVVNEAGALLGVIRRAAVEEALGERTEEEYLKSQGLIREELRSMPLLTRSRRRLSWLSVNILLNVIAASVIAFYQDTLAQVIALAVFLPIISDMSGCSGNQAVAVSMRELSLGLVKPSEIPRVLGKEIALGAINGLALGLLIAGVAVLWKGNPFLGVVVGAAMCLNTVIAVGLGGTLPLLMRRMRMDPALASGPILTTVTDMCGFFIVLSLAAAMISRLGGM